MHWSFPAKSGHLTEPGDGCKSWECCHFSWTMKSNHRNQQEKQPNLATTFGYMYLYPINTQAASKQGYNCHSLCEKMIRCTMLITYSEVARNQNQFSWNNTRMGFHTSVIIFPAVNAQQRCVQPRDGKHRSRELCSIWSNPVSSEGRGGGHRRTRSELWWLTLIRELAGITPWMSSFHTLSMMLSHKCLNESQYRDSCHFAWFGKKSFTLKALSSFLSQSVSYTICHHAYPKKKTPGFI